MIFYTFTAPQDGTYTFTLREREYFPTSQDVPYELRIYRADDDSALKLGTITMTPRDALDLQRVLLSYADKFNADGLPVKFTQEFVSNDVYNTMIQSLAEKSINAARVRAAADEGTSIQAYITDIPYYDKYQPAAGYYADSGLLAATFDAFENFTLPRPASGEALPVETYYSSHEVLTEEEHNREQSLEAMTTFALADNALGLAPMTATNVRLGQITKTIMIVYNKIESTPRLIDPQTLKFNQIADFFLSQGDAKTFREEYGDYFVAGYRWGMTFKASISVTCTDSKILDNVCNTVSAAMLEAATNKSADKSSAALTNTINNLAKSGYVNIEVDQMVINGSDPEKSTFNMNASLSTVADSLRTFAAELPTAPRSRFTPVQVYLMRYREIPSAHEIIPAKLPVKQSLFNAVRNMTETIFRTRCVYNSLMAIPIDHLRNGNALHKEWDNEFKKLVDERNYGYATICESEKQVSSYTSKFQALCDKYRALCERYVFYRRLVEAQSKQTRGFSGTDDDHDGSISGGFSTYSQSTVVCGDYGKYASNLHCNFTYKESAKFWTARGWKVTGDQTNNNWRYVWFETGWRDTNSSSGTDNAYPTVDSKKLQWNYRGGTWRRAEWYFKDKLILMRDSDYPFVGLKD